MPFWHQPHLRPPKQLTCAHINHVGLINQPFRLGTRGTGALTVGTGTYRLCPRVIFQVRIHGQHKYGFTKTGSDFWFLTCQEQQAGDVQQGTRSMVFETYVFEKMLPIFFISFLRLQFSTRLPRTSCPWRHSCTDLKTQPCTVHSCTVGKSWRESSRNYFNIGFIATVARGLSMRNPRNLPCWHPGIFMNSSQSYAYQHQEQSSK